MASDPTETSELFQSIFANASVGIALIDADGRFTHSNAAWQEMLGYDADELRGLAVVDVTAPGEPVLTATTVPSDVKVHRVEKRYLRKDGSEFWGDLCASVVRDDVGSPMGMIGIVVDITERKRKEDELRDREQQYRLLFERNLAGVFRSTLAGEIVECNEAFARIFGHNSIDALLSRRAQDFYPSETARERLVDELERNGELQNHEMVLVRSDGRPVWVLANISLVADRDEDENLLEGTMIDITDRKRADDRLLLQSKALESASSAIVITDAEGTIQWVNPAFTWLTGYSADEAIGQNMRLLKSDRQPSDVYREMWQTISDGRLWHGELVNRRKDGGLFTEEMTITPVTNSDGEIDHYIAVKQDVTDRRRIEEQLRQAQKMEAVGRLAGGVAHDFNNLLQAMLGLTELIQKNVTSSDATTKLEELESHIQSAAKLTRQLLLFSRPESTRQEMLDLNRVVRDTVLLLVRLLRENIELEFEPDARPLALEADRGQVEQIVMNLALNASDAMLDGGRLVIRTGRGDNNTVWLEVEDNGAGIPESAREHLFEPFFTTKERSRGTGLGLSVVHGIVTLHRGTIDIDSTEGEGTVFRISLPGTDPALLAEVPSEETMTSYVGAGERILVVEDDPAVRESLQEILTQLGYRVVALAGRQQVEEIPNDEEFDLLLTDFGLPDGSGTEIAALLQHRLPRLRVIIISGYAEDDVIVRRVMSGDLHFLQKPFSIQTLGRALRSVLGE